MILHAFDHVFFKTKGFIEPKGSRWFFFGIAEQSSIKSKTFKRSSMLMRYPDRQKG